METGKLIIFDLDGTLFKTDSIDIEANNRVLVKYGFSPKSNEEICDSIGEPIEVTVRKFAPNADEKLYRRLVEEITDLEIQLIPEYGKLYSGTLNLLKSLKKGRNVLTICSNGSEQYVNCIVRKFELAKYFEEILYNHEGMLADKARLISILKKKYNKQVSVVVGDRKYDFLAGGKKGCITIAAAYGYGKNEKGLADYIANDIGEIESIINNLKEAVEIDEHC